MGNPLFGVDIAGIIADKVAPGLLDAVITKQRRAARDPNNPTQGRPATPAAFNCKGFWEDFAPADVDGTNIMLNDRKALLIGDTIPDGGIPQKQDSITIEGQTLVVHRLISRDPAAAAYIYHCRDRKGPDGA